MSGHVLSPDNGVAFLLLTAGVALVVYGVTRLIARFADREHRDGELVPPSLGPFFEVESTGGFRRTDAELTEALGKGRNVVWLYPPAGDDDDRGRAA